MAKRLAIVGVASVSCWLLMNVSAAFAQVQSSEQRACINNVNRAGISVAKQQGKEDVNCIKLAGNGDLMITAQACLTADIKGRLLKKTNKTNAVETKYCATLPNFGYTNAATVNQYSSQAERDLLADVFGANLDAAVINCDTNKPGCLCQQKVTKAFDKLAAKKMAEFLKCKKATLKAGASSIMAIEDCVNNPATVGSIAADTKGMIAKAAAGLADKIADECDAESVTNGAFPGDCDTLTGVSLANCIDVLVECRVCQMINDIDSTFVNCDVFDNSTLDGSCDSGAGPTPTITPTPVHTATPTETPTIDPALTFRGALIKSNGDFNYGGNPGLAGANAECNARYSGSHACTINELLDAEMASELDGATDYNGNLVNTSFWVIDSMRPLTEQCYDSGGSLLVWDYSTAHTGHFGTSATLNNGTGDLGTPTAPVGCGNMFWVGCCD